MTGSTIRSRNFALFAVAALASVITLGTPSTSQAGFALRVSTDGGNTFGAAIVDGDGDGFISVGLGPFTVTGTGSSFTNPGQSLVNVAISGPAAPGSYNFAVRATLTDVVTARPRNP
jgi:hypothetical protein